jgi:hypothetical protein
MLAGGCIAHRSKAHKSVMLSSADAEYYEESEGCRELIYIRGILEDFYGQPLPPTPMYIDNAACIAMGKMPVFSERQKHIPIRVCHLKECCDEGIVEGIVYCDECDFVTLGPSTNCQTLGPRLYLHLLPSPPRCYPWESIVQ